MGVASGCGEQEVGVARGSGWNLWVWLVGVYSCKEVCRFPIPTPFFLQQHPYFLFIFLYFLVVHSCSSTFCN